MKKLLFFLFGLLIVIIVIPVQRGAAETPDPTPVPDALVAEALAAKQASYPAWVGDEGGIFTHQESFSTNWATPPQAPTTLDNWTGVVLQKYVDGNWEIFKFQGLSGSYPIPKTQLTYNPASDVFPRNNKDATRIIFASNRDGNYEIYSMDSDGGALLRLTNNSEIDTQPQWSILNDRIIFVTDRDRNAEIYVMNSDGSGQLRLTNNEVGDLYPTISPDGSQIAWLQVTGDGASIWLMNIDGSEQHPISPWYPYAQHLTWSPDGDWLAWDGDFTGDGWNEIIRVKPDGTELQLFSLPTSCVCDFWVYAWAPNSQKVLSSYLLYQFLDDELTIYSAVPTLFYLNGNSSTVFDNSFNYDWNFDRNYDAVNLDHQTPISEIEPLLQYSRASGFFVNWNGKDFGRSGLLNLNIQSQNLLSGTWTDWVSTAFPGSEVFSGIPGDSYYFRSQALDNAENIEPWPLHGDSSTTLYSSFVKGKITDGRGIPQSLLPISLEPLAANAPVLTNLSGDFKAYLKTYSVETISLTGSGYSSFPNTLMNAHKDLTSDFYLPPTDDLIQNGGFENEYEVFSNWQITGTISITLGQGHSGQSAIILGQECVEPCIITSTVIGPAVLWEDPTLLTDRHDGLHLITDALQYHRWNKEDGWSLVYQISSTYNVEGVGPTMIQDQLDNLHVVWDYFPPSNPSTPKVYYARRQPDGQWDTGQAIASGYGAKLASDSNGVIHLVYLATINSSTTGIFYMTRSLSGIWSEPILLAEDYYFYNPLVVADTNNTIHIFYHQILYSGNEEGLLWYITLDEKGVQLSKKIITTQLEDYTLFQDSIGKIYLFLSLYNELVYYKVLNTDGVWSVLEPLLDFPLSINSIIVDSKDRIHMVGKFGGDDYYARKDPETGWATVVRLYLAHTSGYINFSIAVDNNDFLNVAWGNGQDIRHAVATTALEHSYASLSQTITIPVDVHEPTLSFTYQLNGIPGWVNSNYTLSVTSGPTTTQILSSTTPAETWTLGWADVSAWAGQTVTVTFTLHQAADEPYVRFYLDDVSLGSWLTPIPHTINLTHLPAFNAPTQITITGENFIEGATVRLGEISLENVQWLDEHTLQATIPANLPPGRYHLWVTNPGGQTSVLANAVIVGNEIFLPILMR